MPLSWIQSIINHYPDGLTRETVRAKSAEMYDVQLKLMLKSMFEFKSSPAFKSESKWMLIFGLKESERIFVVKPKL